MRTSNSTSRRRGQTATEYMLIVSVVVIAVVAAAYALMIQDLGVPARVVVGVPSLPSGGEVEGSDVAAWVEVQANDRSWLTIPTNEFINKINNAPNKTLLKQQEQQQQEMRQQQEQQQQNKG